MATSLIRRLVSFTPFGSWVARREGAVTTFERKDDFTTMVLTEAPHIHIHYFTTDDFLAKHGWGYVHLVCHECQVARKVIFPNYDDATLPDDRLGVSWAREQRQRFVAEHSKHGGFYAAGGGSMLCPPHYAVTDEIDLRS